MQLSSQNAFIYLPKHATYEEAAAWLSNETSEHWPLERLIEKAWFQVARVEGDTLVCPGYTSVVVMGIWLDFMPESNKHLLEPVFCGRTEGFFAKLVAWQEIERLLAARDGLLLTTELPNGQIARISHGVKFGLQDLRFLSDSLRLLVERLKDPAAPKSGTFTTRQLTFQEIAAPALPEDASTAALLQDSDSQDRTSGRSWKAIAFDYVVAMQRLGKHSTAKDLFNKLGENVNSPESPFEMGADRHRGKLVLRETRVTVGLKTIQNTWQEILRAASST